MKRFSTLLLLCTLLFYSRSQAAPFTCSASFTISIDGPVATFDGTGTGISPFFSWSFGDGSSGYGESVSHTYAADGMYAVCLTVYTADSCFAMACDSVYITGAGGGGGGIDSGTCAAAFTYDVFGEVVAFNNTSEDGGAAFTSWFWDFGDGATSMAENPEHTFSPGYYTVCLTMYTTDSCSSTYCSDVYIWGGGIDSTLCSAGFEFMVDGMDVNFYDVSDGGGADITGYMWSFGDGTSSMAENPDHTYAGPGTYTVCLTIYTTDSCSSTACDVLVITGGGGGDTTGVCEAMFTYDFGFTPWGIFTTNLSDDAGAAIVEYMWDFGDGSTSTEEAPVHEYTTGGVYEICLTIYADSCSDVYCTTVDIAAAIDEIPLYGMQVFPNPAQEKINIQFNSAEAAEAIVSLRDVTGRTVGEILPYSAVAGNNSITMDVSGVENGIYLLYISLPDGSSAGTQIMVMH